MYPRSEALVQATRDLERGRTTEAAVSGQVERDFRELVAVQEQSGLDLFSDGMLGWQDLFRPLAERRPAGISLVPNGDLQFVPETIAREKLARLGQARVAQEAAREVRA